MPAPIAHYQFALRVFARLKKAGVEVSHLDIARIGAQGPDIFFFHRILPWQKGESLTEWGSRLHRISPARLFEELRAVLNTRAGTDYRQWLSYIQGFFCHYALDRAAHPYILWAQEKLAQEEPDYGRHPRQYHFRIESALDTLILRKETGRLVDRFDLMTLLPKDTDGLYAQVGELYHSLFSQLFGISAPAGYLARAPGDMRHALFFMNDHTRLGRKLVLRPVETLIRQGPFFTSLLRPKDTGDWDYANQEGTTWANPFDKRLRSTDSFFEIYHFAVGEATDMILAFLDALPNGTSMREITQDRGFSSDLPGVYEET